MPGPTEMKFDPSTADLAYMRLLGNRKQIEMTTTVWEKIVEDRTAAVSNWVKYCQTVQRRGIKHFVYANNHHAGPYEIKTLRVRFPGIPAGPETAK